MKDVSNKTLAFLLVATIVESLGGTFISFSFVKSKIKEESVSLTGFALIPNGTVSLSIGTTASIKFTSGADTVTFGSGAVDVASSATNCSLSTIPEYTATGCTGLSNPTNGFTIENDGNTNLTVELRANQTATQFIGSGGALFLWNVSYNETGSCLDPAGAVTSPNTSGGTACGGTVCGTEFESVVTSFKTICHRLRYEDSNDQLNIDINVTIPLDASTGNKIAGLIVRGTTVT